MIAHSFSLGEISAVDFGVSLKDRRKFSVPVGDDVQDSLQSILESSIQRYAEREGDPEEFSASEAYGEEKKIFASLSSELMVEIRSVYEVLSLADMANVNDHIEEVDYYFTRFYDSQGRRLVGFKKASQLKSSLRARGRLVRIRDNSLQLIEDKVLKLDTDFDCIAASENIYILNPKNVELIADIGKIAAQAAASKLSLIESSVSFLDFGGLQETIATRPRTARLVVSVATRTDLADISREQVQHLARQHGVALNETSSGRLSPNPKDCHRFLEILDDRRWSSNLTSALTPFRAASRSRVRT
jgi:hypothetical protein